MAAESQEAGAGQPAAHHGKQEYDVNYHGGNFAIRIRSITRTPRSN